MVGGCRPLAVVLAASWVASLLHPACGRVVTHQFKTAHRPSGVALCVIDVDQAAIAVGQAALAITSSTTDCKPIAPEGWNETKADEHKNPLERWFKHQRIRKDMQKQAIGCAISVTAILGSFSDLASFLSSAASDCLEGLHLPEYCAADVTGLTGALSTLATSSMFVSQVCPECSKPSNFLTLGAGRRLLNGETPFPTLEQEEARLNATAEAAAMLPNRAMLDMFQEAQEALNRTTNDDLAPSRGMMDTFWWKPWMTAVQRKKQRDAQIAACVLDAEAAVHFLARAGLAINNAVDACTDQSNYADNQACAASVQSIIGIFGNVGQFISFAISHCPVKDNVRAQCAGGISAMIAGLTGITTSATSFNLTCGKAGNQIPANVNQPILPNRRLAPALDSNASSDMIFL